MSSWGAFPGFAPVALTVVEVDGTAVGVFCLDGKFTAFENVCPHMGGPVCQGKIIARVQERNINIPGGQVELPNQNVVIRPTGEYTSADDIGQTVMAVSADGYPL